MDFLECWTSWLEGVFNSIKGLQVLPVPCSSLSRPPYLLQSKALQIFLFTDFGEKSGWVALDQAPSLILGLQIPTQDQGSLAWRSQDWLISQNLKYCEYKVHFGLITAL